MPKRWRPVREEEIGSPRRYVNMKAEPTGSIIAVLHRRGYPCVSEFLVGVCLTRHRRYAILVNHGMAPLAYGAIIRKLPVVRKLVRQRSGAVRARVMARKALSARGVVERNVGRNAQWRGRRLRRQASCRTSRCGGRRRDRRRRRSRRVDRNTSDRHDAQETQQAANSKERSHVHLLGSRIPMRSSTRVVGQSPTGKSDTDG